MIIHISNTLTQYKYSTVQYSTVQYSTVQFLIPLEFFFQSNKGHRNTDLQGHIQNKDKYSDILIQFAQEKSLLGQLR